MTSNIPPDAFVLIIGAMKSGTSTLYDLVTKHPSICQGLTKEPEFFSEHQRPQAQYDRYEDLWDFDPALHRYVLEASTGYSRHPYEPNVPHNIHTYRLKPKFIYIMRNPIERMLSQYNYWSSNPEWRKNYKLDDRMLLNMSNYYLQLIQYRPLFPQEDMLLLDFLELIADPDRLAKRAWDFLGLPDCPVGPTPRINPTHHVSLVERAFIHSRFGEWCNSLPRPVRHTGKRMLRTFFPPPAKRTFTEEEEQSFRNELAEPMRMLHHEYGFDVARWGFST